MKMEEINDNTIKITVTMADLEDYGIELSDFLTDQTAIENFFYEIASEYNIQDKFEGSEMVSFHVMPNPHGIELLVTKDDQMPDLGDMGDVVDMTEEFDLDTLAQEATDPEKFDRLLREKFEEMTEKLSESTNKLLEASQKIPTNKRQVSAKEEPVIATQPDVTYFIAVFDDIVDVIEFTHAHDYPIMFSELYQYQDEYYLVMMVDFDEGKTTLLEKVHLSIQEHSKHNRYSREFLEEYGDVIIKEQAYEQLQMVI